MKRAFVHICLFILIQFLFVGCGNSIENNKQASEEDTFFKKNDINQFKGKAKFKFEKKAHDFGNVIEGERIAWNFRFQNIGGEDLLISDIKTGCGCTVANSENKRIKSGEISSIEVVFDTYNYKNSQYKTVSITANTEPSVTELSISAIIIKK